MTGSPGLAGAPAQDQMHLLHIYLRDHEAAAAGGVRLAERCASANLRTSYGQELARLAAAIQADRDALRQVCTDLSVRFSRLKKIAAWSGATLGRLKFNGRLLKYSPLSRVVELEALSAGVTAKLRLWQSLLSAAEHRPQLDRASIIRHVTEANEQLIALATLHELAVGEAFD